MILCFCVDTDDEVVIIILNLELKFFLVFVIFLLPKNHSEKHKIKKKNSRNKISTTQITTTEKYSSKTRNLKIMKVFLAFFFIFSRFSHLLISEYLGNWPNFSQSVASLVKYVFVSQKPIEK